MWQRIQTLYLALALGCTVFAAFGFDRTAFVVLSCIAGLLELLALTTYRFRIFQMRTAVLAALLLIGLQAWVAIVYFSSEDKSAFGISTVMPIIAVILDFLAARAILADEMLVRSASRLRSSKKKR